MKERERERNNAKYYGHFGAGARTLLGPTLVNNETLQLRHKVCEKKAHFPHSANIHGPVIAYIARNLVWAKIQGVRVLLASCKCVRRSYRLNFL